MTIEKDGRATRILFDAGSHAGRARREHATARPVPARHRHHRAQPRPLGPHDRHGRARRASCGRPNVPVLIHPDFWSRRRIALPGREPIELPSTSRGALEGAGFEIIEQRQPSFLLDGSLLVTGEVDRTTEFERGFPGHQAYRDGALAARPADPRRPGARGERARSRPRRAHRLRALRASSTSCATRGS